MSDQKTHFNAHMLRVSLDGAANHSTKPASGQAAGYPQSSPQAKNTLPGI
jgi:hypothetical protein